MLFLLLIVLLLIGVVVAIQLIKYRLRFGPEVKLHFENDVERELNEAVADEKFESTLQRTIARKKSSAQVADMRSPEEFDYRIKPRRDRVMWQPSIPGIVHEEDRDWEM